MIEPIGFIQYLASFLWSICYIYQDEASLSVLQTNVFLQHMQIDVQWTIGFVYVHESSGEYKRDCMESKTINAQHAYE